MLKFGLLASGAALALSTASANATTTPTAGAPAPAATQPGSWGPTGWMPVSGAPVPGAASVSAPYAAPTMAPDTRHRHDKQSAYRHYERGQHGPGTWNDPAYAVNDWSDWGFPQPGPGMHWARYYDDAVLVDAYGTIVDTRYGVGWDGPRPGHGYGEGYPQGVYTHPGTTVTHAGNTTITTQVYGGGPAYAAGAYGGGYGGYGYASGGTVFISPGTVTTTTTVTSEETVYKKVWAKKRAWRRPIHRRIVRRPSCGCEAVRGS
jgi:Ni/Co efflux regulator RcnB